MNLLPPTTVNIVDTGGSSTSDTGIAFAFWNRNSGTNQNATGLLSISGFSVAGTSATTYCTGGNKSTDGFSVKISNGTCSGVGTADLHVGVAGGETGTPGGVSWVGMTLTGSAPPLALSGAQQTTVSNSTYNGAPVSYP
jgi:hypothetical protein